VARRRQRVSEAHALDRAVRAAVQAERPGTGIDQITSLDALVDRATAQSRFSSETD
jgi:hypothetical protein